VRIIDDGGRELGERHEGMLEFRGPSVTNGISATSRKTRERSTTAGSRGDRAYIANGDIHITGASRHHHPRRPQHLSARDRGIDLAIPGIRKGGVAAFGSPDPQSAPSG